MQPDHTYLFGLTLQDTVDMDEVILKHEWNHAKLTYEDAGMESLPKECRLHIFKQESSREDFQFNNPYKKRKLYDGVDDDNDDDDDDGVDDGEFFYDDDDGEFFYDDDDDEEEKEEDDAKAEIHRHTFNNDE
jgi:hypothetical protein